MNDDYNNFVLKHNCKIKFGAEIEFYLSKEPSKDFIEKFELQKEKGKFQYEVITKVCDGIAIIDEIKNLKNDLIKFAKEQSIELDFSAKPFDDDYGSSLHIHLNLVDLFGKNLFMKQGGVESDFMLHSIAGMLFRLNEDLNFFIKDDSCLKRFVKKMKAPVNVSWGGNNRTTALRIPDSLNENRRIEHRVASASADPEKVIFAILKGLDYGLENKLIPIDRIYGDASDDIYILEKLRVKCDQ